MQPARDRKLIFSLLATTVIVMVGGMGLCLYQLRRAETGRSNYLPRVVRKFVAAREYQSAKNAEYEDRRLRGYMRVLSLDGDSYPEVWLHLCDVNVKHRMWDAARSACKRVVDIEGPTVSNQTTLGDVYENLGAYGQAAEAYASASRLNPRDPLLQERVLWMFLATGNYGEAISAASNLVGYGSTGSPVDQTKAHAVLGFAYSQVGDREQARAAYTIGLPDMRDPSCSMKEGHDLQRALVCTGVSRTSGHEVSSCIGVGCNGSQ